MLTVKDLTTYFFTRNGIIKAVDGVSFNLEKGEVLGIVGESGSGKSITVKSLLGIIPIPPGEIIKGTAKFNEDELLTKNDSFLNEIRGKRISFIFQDPMTALNPYMKIIDQLIEPLLIHKIMGKEEAIESAKVLLEKVGIKDYNKRLHSYPHEFSGGMRQRVMIAMALITNPEILIADEPTTALDVTIQSGIISLLLELKNELDVSIIFITHDLGVIAEIADKVAVMYNGKIVETGTVLNIFEKPNHPYTKGLLACRPRIESEFKVLPTVHDFIENSESTSDYDFKERMDVDEHLKKIQDSFKPNKLDTSDIILSVNDLSVYFEGKKSLFDRNSEIIKAVNKISFDVVRGSTFGLVGESGCGKTTTGRAILNLLKITDGSIKYNNKEIHHLSDESFLPYRRKLQIVFQDPYSSLNPRQTIEEVLIEPMQVHHLFDTYNDCRENAIKLLNEVGLESEILKRYPHEFSGGQRQRISIARSLSLEPDFMILDEPVSAMDVSIQAQVLNLLKSLQKKRNLTYVFISHDLSVVKFMSDYVAIMNNGKIIEKGTKEQIFSNQQNSYTKKLMEAIPRDDIDFIKNRISKVGG